MEHAAHGCLSDYLQSHPATPLRQSHLVSATEDLAQALHYLVSNHHFIRSCARTISVNGTHIMTNNSNSTETQRPSMDADVKQLNVHICLAITV